MPLHSGLAWSHRCLTNGHTHVLNCATRPRQQEPGQPWLRGEHVRPEGWAAGSESSGPRGTQWLCPPARTRMDSSAKSWPWRKGRAAAAATSGLLSYPDCFHSVIQGFLGPPPEQLFLSSRFRQSLEVATAPRSTAWGPLLLRASPGILPGRGRTLTSAGETGLLLSHAHRTLQYQTLLLTRCLHSQTPPEPRLPRPYLPSLQLLGEV